MLRFRENVLEEFIKHVCLDVGNCGMVETEANDR